MEDSIEVLPPIIPAEAPRRVIAQAIRNALVREISVAADADKRMPAADYLAVMISDAVTNGEFYLADGRLVRIEKFEEWLDLVKFMSQHVDGPASGDAKMPGINVFKIYANIDIGRL